MLVPFSALQTFRGIIFDLLLAYGAGWLTVIDR